MSFVKDQTRLASLTMAQLQECRRKIEQDPKSQANGARGFHVYTRRADKKLEAIAWAITYKLGPVKAHA